MNALNLPLLMEAPYLASAGWAVVIIILIIVLLAALVSNFKIVPQAHSYVVERLGVFHSA